MKVTELLEKVGSNIKDSHSVVAERVIANLTEKEVQSRTDAFTAVLGKLEESRKAAKKIKPDSETYAVGEDGAPATKPTYSFSKAKLEELRKNAEEQKKLEEALNKALDGDFSKVKELAAKGGKPASSEE